MAKKAIYDFIDKYVVNAVCREPLHVGSASDDKSEVLIHPVNHEPFLQATGICGALRGYCEKIYEPDRVRKVFGAHGNDADSESRIKVTDGVFDKKSVHMELRPRLKIDNATGTVAASTLKGTTRESGHKFDMQYVGAGAGFTFMVYYYGLNDSNAENKEADDENIILTALSALNAGEIQFGGQKSNGCGYVEISNIQHKHYDMKSPEDRRLWKTESEEDLEPAELPKLKTNQKLNAYEVTIEAETESELLVRGIAMDSFDKENSKTENIKNAAGNYIIPGSSFKGAVRNRMDMIANYMNLDSELVFEAFGKSLDEEDSGKSGNLRFRDVMVNGEKPAEGGKNESAAKHEHVRTRIRVDKFTGGVRNGALFREMNISGNLGITVTIENRNHPDAVLGLLLLSLRDLAYKLYALGSGQSVGKGYLDVSEISVRDLREENENAVSSLRFEKRSEGGNEITCTVKDDAKILDHCMKTLKTQKSGQIG